MFFDLFTNGSGWIYASLISTIFLTIFILINQYLKKPGALLVFWYRVFATLLIMPIALYIDWPNSPAFYITVVISAFIAGIADIRMFNVAAKYGGGIVSRTMLLIIFMTFPIWFFFDSSLLIKYINEPINSMGIILTLIGVVYFSSKLTKCEISKAAFIAMIPALFANTAAAVLNKYAMLQGSHASVVIVYMFLQSLFILPIFGTYNIIKGKGKKIAEIFEPNKSILFAGFIFSIVWIFAMGFKSTAMISIPNPAYQIAINQLSPVLIILFYYLVKHKEEGDIKSGIGIVICALIMAFLTS